MQNEKCSRTKSNFGYMPLRGFLKPRENSGVPENKRNVKENFAEI
jgi:hypothetical protein